MVETEDSLLEDEDDMSEEVGQKGRGPDMEWEEAGHYKSVEFKASVFYKEIHIDGIMSWKKSYQTLL